MNSPDLQYKLRYKIKFPLGIAPYAELRRKELENKEPNHWREYE